MRRVSIAAVLVLLCPCFVLAKHKKKDLPSPDQLAAITARGRMIMEYDVAAWHASDVIEDLKPDKASAPYYIAHKGDHGWTVVFGRISAERDKFLIVYEADQGTKPEFFTSLKYDPPLGDTGFYFAAAKAIATVLAYFQRENRPYNTYAIPAENGGLYVYLLPAQTQDTVYPLGGDVRYTFTADGNTQLEKRQMHKVILDIDYAQKTGGKTEAGIHTHVLSNLPEDSDVFHVLTRRPAIPEYIGTLDKTIYVINTDGTIVIGK